MNQEKYIGMDVHQATISVAVMDSSGKLIMECILFTLQKLHHQIIGSILRTDVIEMANVRMVQGGNGPGLALHALFQLRRRRKMRSQNFHRHGAVKARFKSAINFSHAARAQG